MEADSIVFGAPLVGMVIGMIIFISGIFQGELTTLAVAGGLVMFLSIVWLSYSVSVAAR